MTAVGADTDCLRAFVPAMGIGAMGEDSALRLLPQCWQYSPAAVTGDEQMAQTPDIFCVLRLV